MPKRKPSTGRSIALALAGGGPEGAVYEIGALFALSEALEGLDFNEMDLYAGVSAGAFVSACLANGLTPDQMCRAIVRPEPGMHPFTRRTFHTPALGEFARRAMMLPKLAVSALSDYLAHPLEESALDAAGKLSQAVPVALFDNDPIRAYLESIFERPGRTDDFRKLRRSLRIIATDLNSGTAVRFGEEGYDDVPISQAVQASTALPGIYPPVSIGGRYFVDGVLLKTIHASVLLDEGVDLLFCINPIVPIDTSLAPDPDGHGQERLITRGLPTMLSQTVRTLIHSRLSTGIASYAEKYPDAEIVIFQALPHDERMFFTNVFSIASRRAICEHAYRMTRRDLLDRSEHLLPILERHGVTLRTDLLQDDDRDLWRAAGVPDAEIKPSPSTKESVTSRLKSALDDLESAIERE